MRLFIALVVAILLGSVAFAYTEAPGEHKGVYFVDHWKQPWLLRVSPIQLGDLIVAQAPASLTPVIVDVKSFDHDYMPTLYKAGKIRVDKDAATQSALMKITVEVTSGTPPILTVKFTWNGPEKMIYRDDSVGVLLFSAANREMGMVKQLQDIGVQGTPFEVASKTWADQPNLIPGKPYTLALPLLAYNKLSVPEDQRRKFTLSDTNLALPRGEYELVVYYFNDFQHIEALSAPKMVKVDATTK